VILFSFPPLVKFALHPLWLRVMKGDFLFLTLTAFTTFLPPPVEHLPPRPPRCSLWSTPIGFRRPLPPSRTPLAPLSCFETPDGPSRSPVEETRQKGKGTPCPPPFCSNPTFFSGASHPHNSRATVPLCFLVLDELLLLLTSPSIILQLLLLTSTSPTLDAFVFL